MGDEDELTGEEMFGTPTHGEAVEARPPSDPCAGYQPRRRWVRLADGRSVPRDWIRESPTQQTPSKGEQVPSYKSAFGSYLKQEDLQGKTHKAVIAAVSMEDVKDNDSGKTEKKLVMHFAGKDKALILNRTNCETLEEITGTDDYGSWVGHTVVLWTDPTVKFGGKTVGGLRLRAVQTVAPPPPLPPPPSREVGADDGDEEWGS